MPIGARPRLAASGGLGAMLLSYIIFFIYFLLFCVFLDFFLFAWC